MNFRHALLVSSALTAAGLLAANAAVAAEKPKLKIYGYQETYFGGADVDDGTVSTGTPTYTKGIPNGAFNILQYGEIRFLATGMTDRGMKWGVYFEKGLDDAHANKGLSADEANLFFQGSWGKVEIGGQDGAADKIQIDASELSLLDNRIVSAFADARGDNLRGAEDQISVKDTSDDSKITYYTPRVSGFQAGVSYIPSLGTRGTVPSGDETGGIEAGLDYKGKTGRVKYELAGVYTNLGEDPDKNGHDTLDSWGLGATVGFGPVSVSGGYSIRHDRAAAANDQVGWTASANYHGGPWEVTLLYVENQLELDSGGPDDEYSAIQLQGAYNLGGGLTAAAALISFDNDARTPANGNDGTVYVGKLTARF